MNDWLLMLLLLGTSIDTDGIPSQSSLIEQFSSVNWIDQDKTVPAPAVIFTETNTVVQLITANQNCTHMIMTNIHQNIRK